MVDHKIKLTLALSLLLCAAASAQDFRWDRVAMDGSRASVPENVQKGSAAKVKALVESYQPRMAELKKVIGHSEKLLVKFGPESPLSNWFADLMLVQGSKIAGRPVDVSIENFGGIRVDMPKGDVIVDDIRSMFPFKNDIVFLKMRGSKLLELFNGMAMHNAWQVLGGVKIVASRQGVDSVQIGGEPLDRDRLYTVITNTFLLHGGDGLYLADMSEEVDVRENDMYQTVMDHIAELTARGESIDADCDQRIVLTDKRPLGLLKPEKNKIVDTRYTEGAKTAPHRLNILHTNDTHSHIDPVRAGRDAGMAGVVERAVFVDSVRTADRKSNVLLVDAGDFEQGTPYFTLFKGEVEIKSMNLMGYDVATVGNHEWDNGIADFERRMKKARFKIVLCNYDFDSKGLKKIIKPYAIFRRGGMKIGVLGVLTDVTSVVDADIAPQLRYKDPVEPVNKWADYLKNRKGCDLVIVLSHLGFTGSKGNIGDVEMASCLRNVDYIIGGHSHTDLYSPRVVEDADGHQLPVVTDYCWGIYVGEIKIN